MPQEINKQSKAPAAVGITVLLLAAGFIGYGIYKAVNPPPAPLTGMIDAKTISVSAKIPGRIEEIFVSEGDLVEKGEKLALISTPEIDAKLAQAAALKDAAAQKASLVEEGPRSEQIDAARADLHRAQAGLSLAEKSWKRIDSLYKEGLVSAQKHDEAAAARANASQLVKAARAGLDALVEGARRQEKQAAAAMLRQAEGGVAEVESLRSEGDVEAPRGGEITRIVTNPGEIAPSGFPILLLTDLSDVWAVFNVREDELDSMKKDTVFKAEVPGLKKTVEFKVYWVNPRGDYAVWRATRQNSGYDIRTFEVRARAVEPVEGLRPGMTVVVSR